MMGKIKAVLAIVILCLGVSSFFLSLTLIIGGIHNFIVISKNYRPSILNVDKFESGNFSGGSSSQIVGRINGEEKFLLVADSVISNQSPKSFLVFAAKGKAKTYHRQEGELELDKTPFKKRAAFCFIFPFIINPLLYLLWKILTKNLE